MKALESVPYHDHLGERLLIRNRKEAGLFELRITEGPRFSYHYPYSRNIGEHANIKANNYPDQDYKRVFMYLMFRCPTWPEMVELASLFFNPGEIVIQFHPCKMQYVNENKTALHLWEPKETEQLEKLEAASTIIQSATHKLRQLEKSKKILTGTENGKNYVAIFCGDNWATWEEVCAIKQEYFGPDKTAFQLNISKEFDLHSSKILTLWDAEEFGIKLPPSDIV